VELSEEYEIMKLSGEEKSQKQDIKLVKPVIAVSGRQHRPGNLS
jgi:hypothetical protein